jgi:hypothetical protein
VVATSYTVDRLALQLFLPKFATQASRLLGVTITGTRTLTTFDASGHQLSLVHESYVRSWSVAGTGPDGHLLIDNTYTGLAPAG